MKSDLIPRRKSDPEEKLSQPAGLRGERQVFPPTPPPENEFTPTAQRPTRSNTVGGPSAARSLSVRGAARARSHDRDRSLDEGSSERYSPPLRRPTVRGPEPRRAYSTRAASSSSSSLVPRSRTVREAPSRRGDRIVEYSEVEPNPYSDEFYGEGREPLRRGPVGSIRRDHSRRAVSRDRYVERERYVEDDEYASDAHEGSSVDGDFEILDARSVRSMRSASSRRPDVKKVGSAQQPCS